MSIQAVPEALKEVDIALMESPPADTQGDKDLKGVSKITLSKENRQASLPFIEDRHRSASWKKGSYSRKVVCAVDPSHQSRYAFDWYLKNIWKKDDLVIIIYCPEPPHLPSFCFKDGLSLPTERWREIISETNTKASRMENDYECVCLEKKLNYMIRVNVSKHAGEEIIKLVDAEKADLIVMGTRGTGAVKRFFLGSVSEYVTRQAKVPCVVVPNEGSAKNQLH